VTGTAASAAATGRRLLLSSQQQQQQQERQRHAQQRSRHFRRLHNAASIPYIPDDPSTSAAAASPFAVIPTASPEMSLQEMLCAIKPYSPAGLQGMKLPAGNSSSSSSSGAITCKPAELGLFQHGSVAFQPIEVPVVFHCECKDVLCGLILAVLDLYSGLASSSSQNYSSKQLQMPIGML
jgi:hypothetical protein